MWRFPALLPAGIFLITCAAFWPAVQAEFNWDDYVNLVTNPRYRGFEWAQIRWMFSNTLMGHYMPLTWLSLALDHALGGMDPWGYHATSLMLHGANAVLLYLIARRLLAMVAADREVGPNVISAGAAGAALIFAVHPQRVESVAWISDRATVLCGTFYLLSVLAYLRAAAPDHFRWRWWGTASVLAFGAALLSKGMAVSLPVTLLLLDVYPLRRWRAGRCRVLVEKLPYCLLAVAGAAVALVARSLGADVSNLARYGAESRIALVAYSLWFYPTRLIWPADLSPLYEVPAQASLLEPRFLLPMLAMLGVTASLLALRHRIPGALVSWAHSAVVVAPVSGVVQSGLQLVADRYSYLANLGFVVLAGCGVVWIFDLYRQGRVRRTIVMTVGSGLVLTIGALGLLTWSQSHAWRDPVTLWTWAVDVDPSCARCHNNLGVALMHRARGPGDLSESEHHLRKAVALRSESAEAQLNLGSVLLLRRRYVDAEAALQDYLRLRPEAADGAERLAVLYLIQGRTDVAIPLLRRARGRSSAGPLADREPTEHAPERARADLEGAVHLLSDGETLRYLGQALLEQGRAADAIVPLRRAVALNPSAPGLRVWLMQAYRGAGQMSLADEELGVLRRLDPRAADGTTRR